MLSIRLARFGKKKKPSYRVIVCQKHKDPHGDYIEKIGHINYYGGEKTVELDVERAQYWLSQGAQPTDTVHNLFIEQGIIKADKKMPHGITPDKDKQAKEAEAKEKQAAEAEAKAAEQPPADEATESSEEKVEEKKEEQPAAEEKVEEKKEEVEEKKEEKTEETEEEKK